MTETSTGKSAGTNVPVADEMVETAAAAIWNRSAREIDGCPPWGGRMPPNMRHSIRSDARAALEAAAPAIAANALRDAANELDGNGGEISMPIGLIAVALRARADRIEGESI